MESALQMRDGWLRLAAQGPQMGLWSWDEVTKELFWDAKTREMFGVPVDGEATLETFYRALHPGDLERVRRTWRYTFEHALPYETELRSLRPDGTARWIFARGSGYYDERAKPICMVGVGFDLSQNYASNGIGILSMKERTRMLHATSEIQSAPTKGAQITVKIPLKNVRAAA